MDWLTFTITYLPTLVVIITLILQLVKYVKTAIKEKNWGRLISLIVKLMEEAETKFDEGASRKEWVIAMTLASADAINYTIDREIISNLIDDLCKMSKIVNPPVAIIEK